MIVRAITVALAIGAATPVAAQEDSILGRWHTQDEGGVVDIQRCGQALCGRLVDAAPLRRNPDQRDVRNRDAELRDRRLKGLTVLWNFTGGPTEWDGGPLYDPHSGRTASRGTLTLQGADRLSVKGCIAPLLCRTQTWRRAR